MTTPETTSFQVRAELERSARTRLARPVGRAGGGAAAGHVAGGAVPARAAGAAAAAGEPADDEPHASRELVDREVEPPADQSGDDGEEEGAEADATVRSGSMAASAIGLAFSVPSTWTGSR